MCTAVKYVSGDFYFGRTLDNDCGYGEQAVIMPRRYPLKLKNGSVIRAHYACVGIASVFDGVPLFYDAVNEKGLAMAGLNFVGNAVYRKPCDGKDNIASFEFISVILGRCGSVAEAKRMLAYVNITDVTFSDKLPNAQLHWMIADRDSAIVVECCESGMNIYDNPIGVMTNNPPFPMQQMYLNNFMCVSPAPPRNGFSDKIKLDPYSRGMGAMGLPGDLSSASRFVRAAFTALNSPKCDDCMSSVSQFFHIMDAVAQTRGSCILDNGEYETTIYTSCCNATKGVYYYSSYDNRRISAVDMHKVNIDGTELFLYPLVHGEQIFAQN